MNSLERIDQLARRRKNESSEICIGRFGLNNSKLNGKSSVTD